MQEIKWALRAAKGRIKRRVRKNTPWSAGKLGGARRADQLADDEDSRPKLSLVHCIACGMSQPLDLVLNHQFPAL
jgi:hypothetical protein